MKSGSSTKLQNITLWAKKGVAVLPLGVKGKAPIFAGGVHSATTNKRSLTKYFTEHPDANYGVATGEASGIFVVDVDGEDGTAALNALEVKHGNGRFLNERYTYIRYLQRA
jgi:Bifunctional DNA primase/polymerase, N-terminal